MALAQQVAVDLLDPDFYAGEPWPVYQWLRDNAPVYRDPNGLWGISRWQDVMHIEKNTARYSSANGSRPLIEMSASMINKDDPFHSRQRKLVAPRFTPGAVRRHTDHVRHLVSRLIDGIAPRGHAEVVEDLAAPLPAMVICELLGFDSETWTKCKWWSEVTMANAGYKHGDPRAPGSEEAMADFGMETMKLIHARRAEPRDDLISVWVGSTIDGEPLTDEEIVNEAILLLDGGAETTRSTIGQTLLALIRHPEQRQKIQDRPELLASTAVEEFIRWASPILNMRRTVTEDHELHGQTLRTGEQVLLMYASANRDDRVFADPSVFDVTRSHNNHVAFGFGTHFCLGANLARLELRVLFEELLRRIPDFRLAPGPEPEFVPGYFTRTLRELHIEFAPQS
jgi:cytochrome P450 family 142 subfamily A polypeptide 1